MAESYTCSCGHTFAVSAGAATADIRCPRCAASVEKPATTGRSDLSLSTETDDSTGEVVPGEKSSPSPGNAPEADSSRKETTGQRPKGLWQVMSGPAKPPATPSSPPAERAPSAPAEVVGTGTDRVAVSPEDAVVSSDDVTDSTGASSEQPQPPRGLWQVMRQIPRNPVTRKPADSVAQETAAAATSPPEADPVSEADRPKARSLWSVMRPENSSAEEQTGEKTGVAASVPLPAVSAGTAGTVAEELPPRKPENVPAEGEDDFEPAESALLEEWSGEEPADEEASDEFAAVSIDDGVAGDISGSDAAEISPRAERPKPPVSRGARRAFWLGTIAVPASALSLLPEIWVRLPANLLGFFALLLGLLAWGEVRRSRGRQRGEVLAAAGSILGTAAMLLGPLLFTPWGERLRLEHGRLRTRNHLQQVGNALNRYYAEKGHYPPGTLQQVRNGEAVSLHNWMTLLLPYLGEREAGLYNRLDLNRPYNDPANKPVMAEDIPAFFASGSSRSKTVAGMAVTHFVALGGKREVNGAERNVGLFGSPLPLTRDQITDGLEHTLIAGEIAAGFPPWGQPGNYRRIGKGLNTGFESFGNADRTGAMFLRADGSVRFFSNKVDPEILRKLSTRDGGEKVPPGDAW